MGVGSSSSGASNFFGALQSDLSIIGDTKDALFGHGGWDQVKADVQNARIGFQNAVFGTHQAKYETSAQKEQDLLKQQQKSIMRAQDQNQSWNASNWKSVSSHVANAHYSQQAGIGGTAKPSDVMSISNPNMKVMNAIARGNGRNMLQGYKNTMDTSASTSISNATSGGGMPSQNTNSAGGSGLVTSQDTQGQSQSMSTSSAN